MSEESVTYLPKEYPDVINVARTSFTSMGHAHLSNGLEAARRADSR